LRAKKRRDFFQDRKEDILENGSETFSRIGSVFDFRDQDWIGN
jgi:hypothetical protein